MILCSTNNFYVYEEINDDGSDVRSQRYGICR